MSELSDERYTDEEKAYLESGGAPPAAPEEPKPRPEDQPAGDEPPVEPQEPDDDDPDGDEPNAAAGDGSQRRRVKYATYERVKREAAEARKAAEELRSLREAEARQYAEFRGQAVERLRALTPQPQPQQQAPKAPTPPPDLDADPMGYIRWQAEQMQAMQERLGQTEQGFQQSAEQQRQVQALAHLDREYKADNHAAGREVPEYYAAYDYLVKRAEQIIRIHNPNFSNAEVDNALRMQEYQLAAAAKQRGMRPAAMIWQMAQVYGFDPQAGQQQAAQMPAQPNPAADQARLDAANRGQQANRSLSGTGRPGSTGESMTLEKLLDMPNDEFTAWINKNPDKYARMQGVN